jgi:predicted amidohydrolase
VPLTIAAAAAPFGRGLEADLARAEAIIGAARERGAGLLVLPECALGGYLLEHENGPQLPPALEPDGPEIARLIRAAGDMVVCVGYTEAGMYSSAVCLSGDGVHGRQRKVHLPPAERFAYTAGDAFAAFDTPIGRLGMLICYDKLFPEAARTLAVDGAEVLCTLAAWSVDRHAPARRIRDDRQTRSFDLCDQARAVENQVFTVASNQTGPWGALRFLGGAKVCDPDGAILARTRAREGLAVATVELAAVERSRAIIDHLADRRAETYGAAAGRAAVAAEAVSPPLHLV